jgi:2-methylcitrate dehydratase PrpD
MKIRNTKIAAIVGGSAAVTAAALGVAILQGPATSGSMAGDMQTGATITESVAPSTISAEKATPEIKGPAALPSEEQGLPG